MLRLAIRLRQRGWLRVADTLLELDLLLSGLGGASRRIRRDRKRRQTEPRKVPLLKFSERT